MNPTQSHPLKPFFPNGARLLMLGSFPPKPERWSMDFFYPNFQNDMWRIFGLVFFKDARHFELSGKRAFDKTKVENFLTERKIALYDTAVSVVRLRDTAADKFLEISERFDLSASLKKLPECTAVAATGAKAADTLANIFNVETPPQGGAVGARLDGRKLAFYRMPSSSRAYPKPIDEKSAAYARMFAEIGIL